MNAKLILLISAISIIGLVCFSLFDYFRALWQVPQQAAAYADQVVDRAGKSLRQPVWNMSWASVREIIQIELAAPYVDCLVFSEQEQLGLTIGLEKIANGLQEAQACPARPGESNLVRTEPLLMEGDSIGAITVRVDPGHFEQQIAGRLGLALLEALALILVLSCSIYFFIKRYLVTPLHGLYETTRSIAETRDFTLRTQQHSQDELGHLAESFNDMLDEIVLRDKELQAYSQELEQKVAQRTAELAEKAQELEIVNARLVELDRLKSQLLSTVSHDLRTPLTSILGFAKIVDKDFSKGFKELAQNDQGLARLAERIHENLSIICSEGGRLTRLINDFLDLSKIESGRMEWNDEEVAPGHLVRLAVEVVKGDFEELKDVELVVQAQDELPRVVCSPDRLLQVLVNLLHNAAKFTARGQVVLAVTMQDDFLCFMVQDTGKGMPPEQLDKIFTRFYKVESGDTLKERKTASGTGLGLAICREIVQHYGGRIWAESEPGKGSTFSFTLPLNPRNSEEEDG